MRFRSSPLDVPEDNPFANDALGREDQIEALTRLVSNIEGPCVLALDGAWGSGKTVFLKMWANVLRREGFEVVEFNAWDTDFSDDPLMALQAELGSTLKRKPNYRAVAKAGVAVVSSLASLFGPFPDVMQSFEDFQKQMKTSTQLRLEGYQAARADIEHFKAVLTETIASDGRLVVCVDELDRCRPDYAIRFLEATKHIFEVEGVTFLLAVNLSELANSVKALYGGDFDAHQYLRRFLDHVLYLQTDRTRYLDHLINSTGFHRYTNQPYVAVSDFLETFVLTVPHMSLRDLEQAIHHLRLVLNSLHRDVWDVALSMMIFRIVVPDTYRQFTNGAISDWEALKHLNDRINRSHDWWQNTPEPHHISYVDVALENTLIGWGFQVRGSEETPSPLLEQRKSEMPTDQSGNNHAFEVVSRMEGLRYPGVRMQMDRIARVTAVIETVA